MKMEKIIYDNLSSKLVADASGGVVNLAQFLDGEIVGNISMYYEEVKDLLDFLNTLGIED
jgi:hypothetical protein